MVKKYQKMVKFVLEWLLVTIFIIVDAHIIDQEDLIFLKFLYFFDCYGQNFKILVFGACFLLENF